MGEMTKTSVKYCGNVNIRTITARHRLCVDIIQRPD